MEGYTSWGYGEGIVLLFIGCPTTVGRRLAINIARRSLFFFVTLQAKGARALMHIRRHVYYTFKLYNSPGVALRASL